MASWPIKRAEGMAFLASQQAADAPFLTLEASVRGITLAALVEKVMLKVDYFATKEAKIAGHSGALQDQASGAESEEVLLAINFIDNWPE